MKKLSPFKLLLIAPSIIITSCGYGLKEVYNGVPYNSSNFFENYYEVWDNKINPYVTNNKITDKKDERELNESSDCVFTSLDDNNFDKNDLTSYNYAYGYDLQEPPEGMKAYGPTVKMSSLDDSFRYGVVSKLFDGQMFCNGYYANARVQVKSMNEGESNGFGVLFSKESDNPSYFMMNFKCSVVTQTSQNLPSGHSDLKLHIGLLYKNDTGYTYIPVTYVVEDVPTNSGDSFFSPDQRVNMYTCFGFGLGIENEEHKLNLPNSRLIGFTIQYEKIADTISEFVSDQTYHAMMLYEVSFPYTTWH